MKKYLSVFLILNIFFVSSLHADPITGLLFGFLKSQLNELLSQSQSLHKQILLQTDLKVITERSFNNLTRELSGHYGVSNLYNSDYYRGLRRASPANMADAMSSSAGHSLYHNLLHYYDNKNSVENVMQSAELLKYIKTNYVDSQRANNANLAYSAAIYNKLDKDLETIEKLIHEIDKTDNVKASQDLNNRIVAQTALLQIEAVKLLAMQMQGNGHRVQNQYTSMQYDKNFDRWS
tara:strand:+ start:222 stop:926 length:705 start_codon:yes stop_codon:yes gene_type:complete